MKHMKKLSYLFIFILIASLLLPNVASAAKLSKKKVELSVNDTITLTLTDTDCKVTWTSSNKKVASVSKKGKVVAKKKGTTVITATTNGESFTCKVNVVNKKMATMKLPIEFFDEESLEEMEIGITEDGITLVDITDTHVVYEMSKDKQKKVLKEAKKEFTKVLNELEVESFVRVDINKDFSKLDFYVDYSLYTDWDIAIYGFSSFLSGMFYQYYLGVEDPVVEVRVIDVDTNEVIDEISSNDE